MQQVRLISPGMLSPGGSTGEVYAAGPYGASGEILISSRGKRSPLLVLFMLTWIRSLLWNLHYKYICRFPK